MKHYLVLEFENTNNTALENLLRGDGEKTLIKGVTTLASAIPGAKVTAGKAIANDRFPTWGNVIADFTPAVTPIPA